MKKKVRLREYRENDLKNLHETLSDDLTKRYFPWMYTSSIEQSDLRLKMRLLDQEFGETEIYAIEDFWTRAYVGEISGHMAKDRVDTFEIIIAIHPEYRGKDYAKAATIEYMKEILKRKSNINKFRLEIAESNSSSKAVAQKLDFEFTRYKDEKSSEKMEYWEKEVSER